MGKKERLRRQREQAGTQNVTLAQLNNYHVTNQQMPSPEDLARFSVIHPDMPQKLLQDALEHSKAARENERSVVGAITGEARANTFAVYTRITVLSLILLAFFGTGLFLLIHGSTIVGFAVLVPAIGYVMSKF